MKLRPVGAALIHTERRTDMTNLIGTFRGYVNVSKRVLFKYIQQTHFWCVSSEASAIYIYKIRQREYL